MCMFHPGSILQQNPYICRFAMSEVTKKTEETNHLGNSLPTQM